MRDRKGEESTFKVVLIGNPSVGKTSLRRAFMGEKFATNYIETLGSDFSLQKVDLGDQIVSLSLWDLAGQPEYHRVHPLYYKGALSSILVFNVMDRESFDDIDRWIDRYREYAIYKTAPVMLIGNQIDQIHDSSEYVTEEQQLAYVAKLEEKYPEIGQVVSIRTSAKTGENVVTGFKSLAQALSNWSKTKDGEMSEHAFGSIDESFPLAVFIAMNQISGPIIVALSGAEDIKNRFIERSFLSNSSIKLVASLDFDDVISYSTLTGTFPWTDQFSGTMYFIAFVVENQAARGKKELFVLGLVADRKLDELLSGIIGVVNGFLHSSMNAYIRLISSNPVDFVTVSFNREKYKEISDEITSILADLRQKAQNNIKSWYS